MVQEASGDNTFQCELVSWNKVQHLSRQIAQLINHAPFRPDIVVAVARGGFVPARLVCDYLDIFNLVSIRIAHYTAGAHKNERARLAAPLTADVQNKNVLIVDDVSDTGDTLAVAVEHIKTLRPSQIKIAVLHHKQVSTFIPDFYAQKIVKWRWLIYPWAVVEDVETFINDMKPRPTSVADAANRLHQEYKLVVPQDVLEYIFDK